jgi:hypothetical protein
MAEIVNCPQCSRKLRVPEDLVGQKVKCPTCGEMFIAELDAPAPPRERDREERRREEREPVSRRGRRDRDDDYDEDDDYRPRSRRRRVRRDAVPHRGTLVLVLGILSIVLGVFGVILGPIAWVLGNNDLKEIRAGRMDREGEGTTNAGRICGMIGTGLGALYIFFCLLSFLSMLGEMGADF